MNFFCSYCKKLSNRPTGEVNRALKIGKVYCDRICFGLSKRKQKTIEQKKAEKRLYDKIRRDEKADIIKLKKAEYYKNNFNREKERRYREENKEKIKEYKKIYYSMPDIKLKKKAYDRVFKANKDWGELAEHQLLILQITDLILEKQSRYEVMQSKGTASKSTKRKRLYDYK